MEQQTDLPHVAIGGPLAWRTDHAWHRCFRFGCLCRGACWRLHPGYRRHRRAVFYDLAASTEWAHPAARRRGKSSCSRCCSSRIAGAGRVSLADSIALVADYSAVGTLPGQQQAMACVLSEIFSSTLNGLVSSALVLATVAEMGQ